MTGINQVWVADITYIRILTGFVFLAVILDVYSRRVVGWSLSKRIGRELTLGALRVALAQRVPGAGLIHHSDRGSQYACHEYVAELKRHGAWISMSAKGNPYDNAFAESFMKTLKTEEVCLSEYESFTDVVERVPEFIEAVYNRKRVHSGIGYLPPVEFEVTLQMGNITNAQFYVPECFFGFSIAGKHILGLRIVPPTVTFIRDWWQMLDKYRGDYWTDPKYPSVK